MMKRIRGKKNMMIVINTKEEGKDYEFDDGERMDMDET